MVDYVIKDINSVEFGCNELDIAEAEMSGLMAFRTEYGESKAIEGARLMRVATSVESAPILTMPCKRPTKYN